MSKALLNTLIHKKPRLTLTLLAVIIYILIGCNNENKNSNIESDKDNPNVSESSSSQTQKIQIFNTIELLRSKLSNNGIGQMTEWKYLEPEYWSHTDYFEIGEPAVQYGLANNLAYYLKSDVSNYAESLKIVLNVNNKREKVLALEKLKKLTEETFRSIDIPLPKGLVSSINKGKIFNYEDEKMKVSLKLVKSKIETFEMIIESK